MIRAKKFSYPSTKQALNKINYIQKKYIYISILYATPIRQ